jgi:hypothetical protein
MPLISLSAKEAFANLRARPESKWPLTTRGSDRLGGVATVEMSPTFQFSQADRIFTIGSCFAREIERALSGLGFDVAARDYIEANPGGAPILNKYVPQAMLNEMRWALAGETFPEETYQDAGSGLFHDPSLAPTGQPPADLETVKARRAAVTALFQQIPQCRVVVVTLGLVEAWYDTQAGIFLNGAPTMQSVQADPDRYVMHLLSYDDIVKCLEDIHALLVGHGHPDFKLLVTVSPVPFKATFTGNDALVANTYSKSVLRAAVEAFVRSHDNTDYFPSYEIVTLTDRSTAYLEDCIHINSGVVDRIMTSVVSHYVESDGQDVGEDDPRRFRGDAAYEEAERLWAGRDYEGLVRLYEAASKAGRRAAIGIPEYEFRLRFGMALIKLGRQIEAEAELKRACRLRPEMPQAHRWRALALARVHRFEQAVESYETALSLAPDSVETAVALATLLQRLGRRAEAREVYTQIAGIAPSDPDVLALADRLADLKSTAA